MNCPNCNSNNVEETAEFDLTSISPTECVHDFKCFDCESLFNVRYHATSTSLVRAGSEWED